MFIVSVIYYIYKKSTDAFGDSLFLIKSTVSLQNPEYRGGGAFKELRYCPG